VHAAFSARELGFESVMINSNPETVSTDYDTSDLLFFEPLTLEDTLNVIERLNGRGLGAVPGLVHGVIVQFGGQTPLNLSKGLVAAGAPIIGTSVDSIDLAEDRDRFDALLEKLKLQRPASGIARSLDEAVAIAGRIGYPVLLRPSYVLGGRGMEICADEKALRAFVTNALRISDLDGAPVLIDKFLDGALEIDVDVVADFATSAPSGAERATSAPASTDKSEPVFATSAGGGRALIAGIMEHIEHAGVHSGDSACTIPPWSISDATVKQIRHIGQSLARELRVRGLMNLQLALKDGIVYILEVNPRASRTVPFVSKATHVPWPAIAAKVMMGRSLDQLGARESAAAFASRESAPLGWFAVKESVFPFGKFPGVDVILGPEMRSTGEVMGIDRSFPIAFAKSQLAAGTRLPTDPAKGGIWISVRESDKPAVVEPARTLAAMGFTIYASHGTGAFLAQHGIQSVPVHRVGGGARPNVLDLMADGTVALLINTPTRTGYGTDEGKIRSTAVRQSVPMLTTVTAASAAVMAIQALRQGDWTVAALQDYRAINDAGPMVETVAKAKPAMA
jgi:carbamoyl-phosphate synthase large subunit